MVEVVVDGLALGFNPPLVEPEPCSCSLLCTGSAGIVL